MNATIASFTPHFKIEFGFGIEKDRDQNTLPKSLVDAAIATIKEEAAHQFGAYTLTAASGGWTNPDGLLVTEPGYTLTVIIPQEDPAVQVGSRLEFCVPFFAAFIRGALRQQAVAVTITPVNFAILF